MADYIALEIDFTFDDPPKAQEAADIFIAELGDLGAESFETTPSGLNAYFSAAPVRSELEELLSGYAANFPHVYTLKQIKSENWNALWEKSYTPALIEGVAAIRADFHQEIEFDKGLYPYIIRINPKMSFGTGKHATTQMMLRLLSYYHLKNLRLLDAGCGAGILGVYAALRGAAYVLGIDIDDWAVENAKENAGINFVDTIMEIHKASVFEITLDTPFDAIAANINRNVLLAEARRYKTLLRPGGLLFLSGFTIEDNRITTEAFEALGFRPQASLTQDGWAALCLQNKE